MPLTKQLIDIPLGGGKQDERMSEIMDAPGMLDVTNFDPSKLGGYVQRRGPATNTLSIGETVSLVARDGSDVIAFSDVADGLCTSESLGAAPMTYADGTDRMTTAAAAKVRTVVANSGNSASSASASSVVYVNRTGYTAYYIVAVPNGGNNATAYVIDEHGTLISSTALSGSTASPIGLASSTAYAVAFWQSGTTLYGQRFDPTTATWDARVTISAAAGFRAAWPEYVTDTGFIVATNDTTPRLRVISEALAITASCNSASTATGKTEIYVEGTIASVLGERTTGVTLNEDVIYEAFNLVSSSSVTNRTNTTYQWDPTDTRTIERMALCGGSTSAEVRAIIQSSNTSETNQTMIARVNTTAAAFSDVKRCPDLVLAHRGYSAGRFGIALDSGAASVDPMIATVQIDDTNHIEVIAALRPGTSKIGVPNPYGYSAYVPTEAGSFAYVIPGYYDANTLNVPLKLVDLTPRSFRSAAASGTVYFGHNTYDGFTINENISLQAPHPFSMTGSVGSGGLSDGTYLVRFTWRTVDAAGNLHESAPSVAETVTLSGGTADQKIECVVGAPLISSERIGTVFLVTYMTAAGGTTFRKIAETAATSLFAIGANRVDVTLTTTPAADATQLYTDSGELDNEAGPPSDEMVWHGNRLWLISGEDGSIWPSKLIRDGYGVAWSSTLAISNPRRQRPVALASLGDRLAVFYPDAIGVIFGDGPDNLGDGGQFSTITITHEGIGAKSREVTKTSLGVVFQAGQTLAVISEGGAVTPLPQIEDAYRADGVADELLVGVSESAIDSSIVTAWSNGEVWLYNMRAQAWSTSSGTVSTAASTYDMPSRCATWRGEAVFTGTDGSYVLSKTLGSFTAQANITTGWIKLAGLQGFQRVWRVWVLMEVSDNGEGASPEFEIRLDRDYDFAPGNPAETFAFTVADVDGTPGYPIVSIPVRPTVQRCSALAVSVYVGNIGSVAPFRVIGVRLEVGVEGKQRRNATWLT